MHIACIQNKYPVNRLNPELQQHTVFLFSLATVYRKQFKFKPSSESG